VREAGNGVIADVLVLDPLLQKLRGNSHDEQNTNGSRSPDPQSRTGELRWRDASNRAILSDRAVLSGVDRHADSDGDYSVDRIHGG